MEVVADGFFSSHGSGALAGSLHGVHVRSTYGGIPAVAVEHILTIATAMVQSDSEGEDNMSKERIKISPDLYDIMPSDYQDLVQKATYGKEDRGWKDIGTSKELIEQHSLCAGCPGIHGVSLYPGLASESGRYRDGRLDRLHQSCVSDGGRPQYSLPIRQSKRDRLWTEACTQCPIPGSRQGRGRSGRRWRDGRHRIRHDPASLVPAGKIHDHLLRQRAVCQYRRTGERPDAEGFRGQNGAGRQTLRQSPSA